MAKLFQSISFDLHIHAYTVTAHTKKNVQINRFTVDNTELCDNIGRGTEDNLEEERGIWTEIGNHVVDYLLAYHPNNESFIVQLAEDEEKSEFWRIQLVRI